VDTDGLTIDLNDREQVERGRVRPAILTFQPEGGLDEAVSSLKEQGVEFVAEFRISLNMPTALTGKSEVKLLR
jgi:hypothetical protein